MGRRIAAAGIRPSLIVSSPAVRAWTTARTIAKVIGYPLEFLQREKTLYFATVDEILDVIVAQDPKFNSLMLVGHYPGFTSFANYLVPGLTNNLPTAGIVCVQLDQDNWDLYERPEVELVLHDFPKNRPEQQSA